ncbi:hypothetical protein L6164_006241 [Bauhinia variegata]|uniref:Uncharacterized protein n=1 Tax=Bauhinia variegata TaxID=167791 RepID=A0ACB9PTB6_BAUVA|nr:hypothetical protein L6164_006241 [Bauhinia variegata]
MGLNCHSMVVMMVALLIFLMGKAKKVDARLNPYNAMVDVELDRLASSRSSKSGACCNNCVRTTNTNPPQCQCIDLKEDCSSAVGCELCICAAIAPPRCRCLDTTPNCYEPCSTPRGDAH